MIEAEIVRSVREYFESLFPKVCFNCNRRFETLREYILITKPVGPTMSFDAELADWKTAQPIGSMAQANCPCGSTLTLSTERMPLPQRLALLNWVRMETQRQGLSPSELLGCLRDEVRKQVLTEPVDRGI
jgi:hypothetical protein